MRREEENHEVIIETVDDDSRDDAFSPVRDPAKIESKNDPHREFEKTAM
jgi:hypothetical protein